MRKFVVVWSMFVLLLFTVVPAFAQDDPGTIAELVVASASGDDPQFTVLLAAVQAADPVFLETLSSEELPAGITVFAPTDAAFADLLASLETTPEDLLANTDLLNTVLAYHVVPGYWAAEDVVALDGAYIGTLLDGAALSISAGDDGVFVNDSQIIQTDIQASNGVVHVIDAVLVPVVEEKTETTDEMMEDLGTIADVVVASATGDDPQFTVLLAAVQAADPVVLANLSEQGPWTVFAPTDAAFAAALDSLGITAEELLADAETLTSILSYHVVPGFFTLADITTLAESAMAMDMSSVVFASGLPGATLEIADGQINGINIAATDIMADNGVIHVIDGVLLPPSDDSM